MIKKGYLVISLDFELLWGMKDKSNCEEYKENVINARYAIPQIIEMFEKYNIHATWATVGLIMNKTKEELLQNIPPIVPKYKNKKYSTYEYFDGIGESEETDPYHYGEKIVLSIIKQNNQEVGTHTYSHYYCSELGADKESFESDISKARNLMSQKYGLTCKSIVFPRNQYTDDSIDVIKKLGILCYRGNPKKGYDSTKKGFFLLVQRALRFIDSYIPIYGAITYPNVRVEKEVVNVAASRFFRPYSGKKLLEYLKIKRIKGQMKHAAKQGEMFHLWWHPHNFGEKTNVMINELEDILKYYTELNSRYSFESVNMKEYAEILKN